MLKSEWKGLLKSKIFLIIMAAIIAIPTIYTTLFLGSMWDPYGNIEKLPVAIVNQDVPVAYEDRELNVGKELVENLKKNESLDFHFIDKEKASEGLKKGLYYMVITIPHSFSGNASTLMDESPKKMELDYETNPGTNYIASKMSETALLKIKESVAQEVTRTYTEAVFDQIADAGAGMKEASDGAAQIKDGTGELKDGSKTISDNLKVLADSTLTFKEGSDTLSVGLKTYTAGVAAADKGAEGLNTGAADLNAGTVTAKDGADALAAGSADIVTGAAALNTGAAGLNSGMSKLGSQVPTLQAGTKALADGSGSLASGTGQIKTGGEDLKAGVESVQGGSDAVLGGAQKMQGALKTLSGSSDGLKTGIQQMNAGLDRLLTMLPQSSSSQAELADRSSQAALDAYQQDAVSTAGLEEELNAAVQSGDMEQAAAVARKAVSAARENESVVKEANGRINQMAGVLAQDAQALRAAGGNNEQTGALAGGIQQVRDAGTKLSAGIDSYTGGVAEISDNSETLTKGAQQVSGGTAALSSGISNLNNGIASADQGARQLAQGTQELQGKVPVLADGAAQLSDGAAQLDKGSAALLDGTSQLNFGASGLSSGLKKLLMGTEKLQEGTGQLKAGTSELTANNSTILDGSGQLSDGAGKLNSGASQLYDGSGQLSDGIEKLSDGSGTLRNKLSEGADKVNSTKVKDNNLDMFSAPVNSDGVQITKVENNGHAMAPYMMSVALWVGCIAFCLMYPLMKYSGELKNGLRWWASKASVLFTIAILQAIVMIGALHYFNGFNPVQMGRTLAVSILASVTFMAILYFFNVCIGKAGSFLMLIFMVVQLAGSAGTYPVELSGSFVPAIHNWLPFTYTVNAFRSTISGGESIRTTVLMLLILLLVFSALTILIFRVRTRRIKEGKRTMNDLLENMGLL